MADRLNSLPQELLHRIVQLLKYDTLILRNLCLTSRRLAYEARLQLYADVRIIPIRQIRRARTCIHFKRSKKFFRTLVTHNTFLAKYVRCFVYGVYFPEAADTLDLVMRSLRLMTNLQILEFIPVDKYAVPTNLFQGCTFQLTHFHCNFNVSTEFLSSQHALQSLYIEGIMEALPSDCFPNLSSLRVRNWGNIVKLLPSRSIRHLEFAGVLPNDPFSIIAPELRNLTVFVFEESNTSLSHDIKTMIPYLTQLHLLRVNGGSQFVKELYSMPEIMLGLPNLGIFICSRTPPIFSDGYQPENYLNVVNVWFQKMPKFEAAYFQMDYGYGDAALNYERWLANDTSPTMVGREEALHRHRLYGSYAEEYEVSSAAY